MMCIIFTIHSQSREIIKVIDETISSRYLKDIPFGAHTLMPLSIKTNLPVFLILNLDLPNAV